MHETLLFAGWVTTGTRPVRPHRPAASREFELDSLVLYRSLDDRQCYPDWWCGLHPPAPALHTLAVGS